MQIETGTIKAFVCTCIHLKLKTVYILTQQILVAMSPLNKDISATSSVYSQRFCLFVATHIHKHT